MPRGGTYLATMMAEYDCARQAWWEAAEYATVGYETELAEYKAAHPMPTLREFMLARKAERLAAEARAAQEAADLAAAEARWEAGLRALEDDSAAAATEALWRVEQLSGLEAQPSTPEPAAAPVAAPVQVAASWPLPPWPVLPEVWPWPPWSARSRQAGNGSRAPARYGLAPVHGVACARLHGLARPRDGSCAQRRTRAPACPRNDVRAPTRNGVRARDGIRTRSRTGVRAHARDGPRTRPCTPTGGHARIRAPGVHTAHALMTAYAHDGTPTCRETRPEAATAQRLTHRPAERRTCTGTGAAQRACTPRQPGATRPGA